MKSRWFESQGCAPVTGYLLILSVSAGIVQTLFCFFVPSFLRSFVPLFLCSFVSLFLCSGRFAGRRFLPVLELLVKYSAGRLRWEIVRFEAGLHVKPAIAMILNPESGDLALQDILS